MIQVWIGLNNDKDIRWRVDQNLIWWGHEPVQRSLLKLKLQPAKQTEQISLYAHSNGFIYTSTLIFPKGTAHTVDYNIVHLWWFNIIIVTEMRRLSSIHKTTHLQQCVITLSTSVMITLKHIFQLALYKRNYSKEKTAHYFILWVKAQMLLDSVHIP